MAMNDTEIISSLKKIIDSVGVGAFANHARANALISDYFPGNDNAKTRKLIKSIIDVDALPKISSVNSGDLDGVCQAVKKMLIDDEFLSEDIAEMAVCFACGALGKKKPNFPKPVPPKSQTAPPSSSGSSLYGGQSSNSSYSPTKQPTQPPRTVNNPSNNTYGLNLNHHVKRKKKVPKKLIGWTITLCVLAALAYFVVWPKMIYPNMANENLHTPEIVQTYSGTYSTGSTEGDAIVTITSCDQSGNLTGFFEFIVGNTYGKYEVSGKITEKKNNGNLVLSLTPGQWVVQPGDYSPLEAMTVEITDNYQSFECSKYSMYWAVGENDEYSIKTVEDLQKLSGSEATYQLKNDIDLSGVKWTPIEGFCGTLIGNGYSIKNLTIESSSANVGFFSTLNGAVTNLIFENANIKVSGRNENIGILCGQLKGTINNISVSGSVTAEKSVNVGGVCGYVSTEGSYTLEIISNNASVTGLSCIGGCFGKMYDYISNGINTYSVVLSNIKNNGTVHATEDYAGGVVAFIDAEASGIGGSVTTTIIDCENVGNISGNYYVAGIVGSATCDSDSFIDSCTNAATISAEAYTGCIAGTTGQYLIVNCSNEGSTLNASGYYLDDGKKYAYVGGIVGKGTCLKNCTNYIDINYNGGGDFVGGIMGYCNLGPAIMGESLVSDTAEAYFKNLTNKGNVSGNSYVGGIIGGTMFFWSNGCTEVTATFEKIINTGDVAATNNYAGGIAGYMAGDVGGIGGRLSWCFYDSTNEASISGSANVGGLFGGFKNGEVNGSAYASNTVTIEGCSSTGKVSGNSNCDDIIGFNDIKK